MNQKTLYLTSGLLLLMMACNFLSIGAGQKTESTVPSSGAPGKVQATVAGKATGETESKGCLVGTWRVNSDSYISFMNALNPSPQIVFKEINPPIYFTINDDFTFAIYVENVALLADMMKADGTLAGTLETDTEGVLKGTLTSLEPDKAYPGVSFIAFNISSASQVKTTDIKINGQSIVGTAPTIPPMIDQSLFNKVGYTCKGDGLQFMPVAPNQPSHAYKLTRDQSWRPSTP
jgi:hypothetical protein